jgi:hypothetical protein
MRRYGQYLGCSYGGVTKTVAISSLHCKFRALQSFKELGKATRLMAGLSSNHLFRSNQLHRRAFLSVATAGAATLLLPSGLQAASVPHVRIRRSTVTVLDHLPRRRPDTPIPSDPNTVLYVQHSLNQDTIVYTAQLGSDQLFDVHKPVDVFWRRYAGGGHRDELSLFERLFVFGVRATPWSGAADRFRVRIAAYGDEYAILDAGEDGVPRIMDELGPYRTKLVYIYAQVGDFTFIPKVNFVEVFGIDIASGRYVSERLDLDM